MCKNFRNGHKLRQHSTKKQICCLGYESTLENNGKELYIYCTYGTLFRRKFSSGNKNVLPSSLDFELHKYKQVTAEK